MEAYRLQTGVASPFKRTVTAYNLFVQQEKDFLLGFDFEDIRARIGKHCGDRWKSMSKEEKELYKVLRAINDVSASSSSAREATDMETE